MLDNNTWNLGNNIIQNDYCRIAVLESIWLCANKRTLARLKVLPTNYLFTNHIYSLYKQDLNLDNLLALIYCKTKPNQTICWWKVKFPTICLQIYHSIYFSIWHKIFHKVCAIKLNNQISPTMMIYIGYIRIWNAKYTLYCPIGWGCRIHHPQWVSWIWH